MAQSTAIPFGPRIRATFSAWLLVMVRSGDSSRVLSQIARYFAPLVKGRLTSTMQFRMNHHSTRFGSITRRSERNSLRERRIGQEDVPSGVPRLMRRTPTGPLPVTVGSDEAGLAEKRPGRGLSFMTLAPLGGPYGF